MRLQRVMREPASVVLCGHLPWHGFGYASMRNVLLQDKPLSSDLGLLKWNARDLGCLDNNRYHTTIVTNYGRY